jgi:hypothetical protein
MPARLAPVRVQLLDQLECVEHETDARGERGLDVIAVRIRELEPQEAIEAD